MRRYLFTALFVVSLLSCKEETKINLVKGRLFQQCDQLLAGSEIALKTNETGSFSNSLILGSGISDGNGNFQFTYELEEDDEGKGDLIFVKKTGFETLLSDIKLNENLTVDLYRNNNIEVYVQLGGARVFNANDTLFFGVESIESFIIQPSNGFIDTLNVNFINTEGGSMTSTFYYGIGVSEFNRSKEAASIQDSTFQNISLSVVTCTPDTASLTIN